MQKYHGRIDALRIVAIFLVLLLHTVTSYRSTYTIDERPIVHGLNAFSRIAVPRFFLITGYLLLQKQETLTIYITKRFSTVLIPTLIWSGIYLLRRAYQDHSGRETLFHRIATGDIFYHMWFIFVLIGIYLMIPILRFLFVPKVQRPIVYLWIVLWYSTTLLGEQATLRHDMIAPRGGYVGYCMVGGAIAHWQPTKPWEKYSILVIGLCGCTVFGSILLSHMTMNPFSDTQLHSLNPIIIISSICLFLGWRQIFSSYHFPSWTKSVAGGVFFFYFAHPLLLHIIYKYTHLYFSQRQTLTYMRIILMPLTIILALLISFIANKMQIGHLLGIQEREKNL